MPPRNNVQKVRLCQLPGSGVGQMRNGGARSVRSRSRSRMVPAPSAVAKTKSFRPNSFMRWARKQIRFADLQQSADSSVSARSRGRGLDLLIVVADLGLLGELGIDRGEDPA